MVLGGGTVGGRTVGSRTAGGIAHGSTTDGSSAASLEVVPVDILARAFLEDKRVGSSSVEVLGQRRYGSASIYLKTDKQTHHLGRSPSRRYRNGRSWRWGHGWRKKTCGL